MDTPDSLPVPPPSTLPLPSPSPSPINPPPPPPAIGARLFTRALSDTGEVCWVPARPDRDPGVRAMLVEIPDAVTVWTSSNLVAGELVELVGDLQRITVETGNPLEALAPAGWVYVGSVMGNQGVLQMFGRGEPAIRAVAVILADLMSAGNHPPAPGEQGPVPPIVEVEIELPWMVSEGPASGAQPTSLASAMENYAALPPLPGFDDLPSMMTPAPDSGDDLPTVKLPLFDNEEPIPGAAPSRAVELISRAFASIKHAKVTVDEDDGYTVLTGERDLINPADKHSSDWLTDILTHIEPTPANEQVILELVDCDNAHWDRPLHDEDIPFGNRDGVLIIGEAKLYIGAELAAFGEALYQLATLPPDDDRGPVEAHADDAGMLVEADPVEVCADLLAEVLDDTHRSVNGVTVSEHEDESVVVIGSVTIRISAPHFPGGSARVARALGALGEALESRFLARFGETASEE